MIDVAGLLEALSDLLGFGQFALISQRQRLIYLADQRIQTVMEIFYLRAVGRFIFHFWWLTLLRIYGSGTHILLALLHCVRGVGAQHRFVIARNGIHIVGQIGCDSQ